MKTKPKLLDLFCGAGGAAMGYHQAGFEVIGVDIAPQPRFPFEFHQADAMTFPLQGFDVIHASPPCQAYSKLRRLHPTREYPELVEPIRQRIKSTAFHYVIENVEGAPLLNPIMLCGSMFNLATGDYQLRRHRLFESNAFIRKLYCAHEGIAVGVFGHGSNQSRRTSKGKWRGRQATRQEAVEAMGIDWMIHREITQSIPPEYTRYIGQQLLAALK